MWKDATTYSRDDKERKPTAFELVSGDLRIYITCGHLYYPGQWIMHCRALGVDTFHLKSADSEEKAKTVAINLVRKRIARLDEEMNNILAAL